MREITAPAPVKEVVKDTSRQLPPPNTKLHNNLVDLFSLYVNFLPSTEKVKVQVYSLVSRVKPHSPGFTQLPPGRRTCSFISHLNSPGSIQPGCHFRRTELFKHTSLHCPTRYPLSYSWVERVHV